MTTPPRRAGEDSGSSLGNRESDRLQFILIVLLPLIAFAGSVFRPAAAWPSVGLLTGAMIVVGLVASARGGDGGFPRIPSVWLVPMLAGFAVAGWGALGLLWSPLVPAGRPLVMTWALGAALFATISFYAIRPEIDGAELMRLLLRTVFAVGVFEAVWGSLQVHGPAGISFSFAAQEQVILANYPIGDPLREGLLHAVRSGRAAGTLGAPNIYSSFVAAGAIVGVALGFAAGCRQARILAFIGTVLCAVAVLLSQSRGGLLAMLGGWFLLCLYAVTCRVSGRQAALLVGGAIAAAVVAMVAVGMALFALDAHNSRWLGTFGLTIRMAYWRSAISMWNQAPIFGNGPGAFEALYAQFRTPGADETKFAHSWLFEQLALGGLVGTGLVLTGLAGLARAAWPTLRMTLGSRSGVLLAGAVAAFLAVLGHGLLEYTLSTREGVLLLALLAGAVVAATPSTGRARVPAPAIALPAALLLLAGLYWLLVIPQRAEALRENARAVLEEGGDPLEALAFATAAVEADPADAEGYELRAYIEGGLGGLRYMEDMQKARELNPHSARLAQELALHHVRLKEWDAALALQREAISLHPLDLVHRLTLARILASAGRTEEARAAWRDALAYKAFRDTENDLRAHIARELGLEAEIPPVPGRPAEP
ncbi:hypothetical protein GC173_15725 [bacterium]|nr:hypothetical protein [bacterium]